MGRRGAVRAGVRLLRVFGVRPLVPGLRTPVRVPLLGVVREVFVGVRFDQALDLQTLRRLRDSGRSARVLNGTANGTGDGYGSYWDGRIMATSRSYEALVIIPGYSIISDSDVVCRC